MKKAILLTTVMAAALMGCEQANDAVDKASSTVTDAAKDAVSAVEETSADVLDAAKETANGAVEGAKDVGSNIVDSAKDATSSAVESTKEAGASMLDGAKDMTSKAVDSTKEMGADALSGAKDMTAGVVDGTKEKVAGATAAVAGLAAASSQKASGADLAKGEEIYSATCKLCHDTGMMDAPKLGDAGDWGARMAQGMDAINANAINGIRGMPAKGGKASLTDDEVKAAVAYMLSKSH